MFGWIGSTGEVAVGLEGLELRTLCPMAEGKAEEMESGLGGKPGGETCCSAAAHRSFARSRIPISISAFPPQGQPVQQAYPQTITPSIQRLSIMPWDVMI